MAISSKLRDSNYHPQKMYYSYGRKPLDIPGPGFVDPEQVPDNSITMLVETGQFTDNESTEQPAKTDYTLVKTTHIGIRYLEVHDDSIKVFRGVVNGRVSEYKPSNYLTCQSLGGTWNSGRKVWILWNVEIPINNAPATKCSLKYYQVRPGHSYGYFERIVMNDWGDSVGEASKIVSTGANYIPLTFPKTQYAPIREIIVSASHSNIINLNAMQYLYLAYISGYTSIQQYKIAKCPVLTCIGSLGLYGARYPSPAKNTWSLWNSSFSYNPKLEHIPGIEDAESCQVMMDTFSSTPSLGEPPWVDMRKCVSADRMFCDSGITYINDYEFDSLDSASSIFRGTQLTTLPPLRMPKATFLTKAFSLCTSLRGTVELFAPKAEDIRYIIAESINVSSFNLTGGAKPINMYSAFTNTTNLSSINLFDTSLCTNISYTFEKTGLTTLPAFNFSSVVKADRCFYYSKLLNFSPLNFSKAQSLDGAFAETSITLIPQITTTTVLTDARNIFRGCLLLTGAFDNYADDTPATHPTFDTTGVTNAGSMFSASGLTRIDINLPKATDINNLCSDMESLTSATIHLTDGVITDTQYLYYSASKLKWENLSMTGYTSAITNVSAMYCGIDWNTPDNTGTVFVNLPAVTDAANMLEGVHGRQWIKVQNLSKVVAGHMTEFFGSPSRYPFDQYPARKLWILNRTCQAVFDAWKAMNTAPRLVAATTATFEITLESVTNFDPAWLNSMVRLTRLTFINEPLDFQETASLWTAGHNFQTNPLLTEINLQGTVTPEFVKAIQVVAPVTVNYTGAITILHHNDLAWT